MPRSQRNDNFIDKTFTIVADILLRLIPTTQREKEAFTYYRDGVIWTKKKTEKLSVFLTQKNLSFVEVRSYCRTNPYIVYPRSKQPERFWFKKDQMLSLRSSNLLKFYSIGKKWKGKSVTCRNRQYKSFVIMLFKIIQN